MKRIGIASKAYPLKLQQIKCKVAYWNLPQANLIEESIKNDKGHLSDCGALTVDTGLFTGRSPKDRFIVQDDVTQDKVWWVETNQPLSEEFFDRIYYKMLGYLEDKKVYVRDMYAGADKTHRLNVRFITTYA